MRSSTLALLSLIVIVLATHFLFYPKWQKERTEATISWDVSGYYMYLPATFIYKDLKQCAFRQEILQEYSPTPDDIQGYIHPKTGNYVMKYSLGQAVQYLPFFAVAHVWASLSDEYPADGYSLPYQLLLSLGSLLVMILGLVLLRRILLTYYGHAATSYALVAVVLGSNYLNYSAIDGAMTHNYLFTIYAALIWLSIRYHKSPSFPKAIAIGLLVGLAALTRPTEIIVVLLPILWGVDLRSAASIRSRIASLRAEWPHLLSAAVAGGLVGSLQLLYWRYVGDEWIIYSYEDQGFSWLSPHVIDGLFSFKSGWLTYSPLMLLSLVGMYPLLRQHPKIAWAVFSFSALFIYIAFAWDIWWYGGSLGQRTMVQAYPVLALPIAACAAYVNQKGPVAKWLLGLISILLIYISIWFTYQAHRGGMLHVGQMTKAYYLQTVGRWQNDPEHLKLLDTKHIYQGERASITVIYQDTTAYTLDQGTQFSPAIEVASNHPSGWIRVSADIEIGQKEWDTWKMSEMIVELKRSGYTIKRERIRLQRHLGDNQQRRLHIDLTTAQTQHDKILVKFWNGGGGKPVKISNVMIEAYND